VLKVHKIQFKNVNYLIYNMFMYFLLMKNYKINLVMNNLNEYKYKLQIFYGFILLKMLLHYYYY